MTEIVIPGMYFLIGLLLYMYATIKFQNLRTAKGRTGLFAAIPACS
jgi:hypothetical protein